MTLQQLRYIIAIDRFRNFARAADELGITQPTLSALLRKLENELDARLFERTNKSVAPTATGEKILRQARVAVGECERIYELVAEEQGVVAGRLDLSVGPTIAPYLLPQFIGRYTQRYPDVELNIAEMKHDMMLESLRQGLTDAGIAIGGYQEEGLLEIPLYAEPFWVYVAESCLRKQQFFRPEELEHEQLWIMKEPQCLRESAFSFCRQHGAGRRIYEAGSIETLIRIVDANGGFTIIPEMHLRFLDERQRRNVRRIEGGGAAQRRVSIYVRHDFIRQRLLNSIVEVLVSFIPGGMVDRGIARHGIRL